MQVSWVRLFLVFLRNSNEALAGAGQGRGPRRLALRIPVPNANPLVARLWGSLGAPRRAVHADRRGCGDTF